MPVMGTVKFQRFFRAAAGLQVDRNDLKRYTDFIDDKIYDVILIGKASAKANLRDVIEPWDLPITKGLQESIHRFENSTRRSNFNRCSISSRPARPWTWPSQRRQSNDCR